MIDNVLISAVLVLFPFIIYFLYIIYENVFGEKGKNLFFSLAVVSSIYLVIKYSVYLNYDIYLIKIILFMCIFYNKRYVYLILSVFISIYLGNSSILIVEYVFLYLFINKSSKFKLIIILLCDLVVSYILNINILFNILYVVIGYLLYLFLEKTDSVINIYNSFKSIKYENEFRNSLFEVTHEIKNPIAVCKGYIDMIDVNNISQVSKYIPIIKSEIDRTLTLMSDYLSLTKLNINLEPIDISLLLDDVCESISQVLIHKNIHFTFDILDDEVCINGDYDRLKQVFINLVKNSVEAIGNDKDGEIKIKMELKKNVVITISDNGCGISKKDISKVGTSFFTTKENGTGLGVKLSKEIISGHNGSMRYQSKEKKGTKVIIKLPFVK